MVREKNEGEEEDSDAYGGLGWHVTPHLSEAAIEDTDEVEDALEKSCL